MLIFNEHNKTEIIDNINSPTLSNYFWVLDLDIDGYGSVDYTLSPIVMFEEITGPTFLVRIENFVFYMPAHWHMLVVDEETSEIDVVSGEDLLSGSFQAFLYGVSESLVTSSNIEIIDYKPYFKVVTPALNKNQLLCHPISPERWVNIAPTDTHNKYLKGKCIGDII